jgi:hypothetical protein
MTDQNKKVFEETDKYREQRGRKASQEGRDSEFLNKDALDEDLISTQTGNEDADIVNSEHPENQEWNAREAQNSDKKVH